MIELLNDNNLIRRIKGKSSVTIDSLLVGLYNLRLIEDANQNGVWDSGSLINKSNAEKVILYPKEINIRENWDVIVEWETN